MDKVRRYDLDWLRVIVFGLLIFYHVGMFFVPWGFHLKNNEIYGAIRWPMLFLNQWRLPILFVISGMGTWFALSYRTGKGFAWERIKRLGLPLAVGMLLIVPPQIYVERLANGQFAGNYWSYLTGSAFQGVYPEGNISWHHLWFLPYLLIFSLLLIPVFTFVRDHPQNKLTNWLTSLFAKRPLCIYLMIIPLYFYESLLEPFFNVTHALVDDWFNFISSMTLFLYGFLLMSMKEVFWDTVNKVKNLALVTGCLSFSMLLIIWLTMEDSTLVHFTEAFIKVTNLWSWILAIFGFGARYLNKTSRLLTYCNRAVYPFYILHQTIMLIIAYYLMNFQWGFVVKFVIMILGTFGISWILYEFLIKRVSFLKPLFGLKK